MCLLKNFKNWKKLKYTCSLSVELSLALNFFSINVLFLEVMFLIKKIEVKPSNAQYNRFENGPFFAQQNILSYL